jgi:hypothetical protein
MWDRESPSSLDLISRSLAFSPVMVVCESPTADLKSVSNLAWSWAVMKDSRMFGILLTCFSALRPLGLGVPPVWKDAAISVKPVGCGF